MIKTIKDSLSKTRNVLTQKIKSVFKDNREDFLEELEEILITSDVGVELTIEIIKNIQNEKFSSYAEFIDVIKTKTKNLIPEMDYTLNISTRPSIIVITGVNGSGKTTTCGKLAYKLKNENYSTMLVPADTFRAAAIEQLEHWAKLTSSHFINAKEGADPASVVFDALKAAYAKKIDVVIVDTAGRLHTRIPLMKELEKIYRVISKNFSESSLEILLTLDANFGQNALRQLEEFSNFLKLTGIILTKLDGTAKGGVGLSILRKNYPIKLVGTGERVEDLAYFDLDKFLDGIFSND